MAMTDSNLKERLGRRETWTQIVGYALAILWPFAHLWLVKEFPASVDAEIIAAIHAALAAGIIGAGTVAQISRAEQRAQAIWPIRGVDEARVEQLITSHERSGAHGVAAPKLEAAALPDDDPHATTPDPSAPQPPPKDPLPAHVANLERRLQRLEHPLAGDGSPPGAAVAAVPGGRGSNPSPATTTPPPNAT